MGLKFSSESKCFKTDTTNDKVRHSTQDKNSASDVIANVSSQTFEPDIAQNIFNRRTFFRPLNQKTHERDCTQQLQLLGSLYPASTNFNVGIETRKTSSCIMDVYGLSQLSLDKFDGPVKTSVVEQEEILFFSTPSKSR